MKFVYVLDSKNKVQYRRVTTGAQQTDGLRVIDEGLEPDDWVVIGGLLQVRPRMVIEPEKVSMPTLADRPATGELAPTLTPSPKSRSNPKSRLKTKPASASDARPSRPWPSSESCIGETRRRRRPSPKQEEGDSPA